ncbi:MAG: diacylglycerol kinase family lipid kinase [Acidobacteriota bacterium]|nr:diacylglycerol kinase family lipid kinase [Acidobacteriota bacterium]
MSNRTIRLISNPNAGRGGIQRAREVARFCEHLRAHGIAVEVEHTTGPHDATRLARLAAEEGVREVIVSGGDGTINEALQGLIGTGVRLAVWPTGTANVLARELGVPFDAVGVAEVVLHGAAERISVGCAIEEQSGARRYFLLMAGIGLDASLVGRVMPGLKRRIGEAAFWYAGLEHLARWQPEPFTIEIEGQSFPATFAAIGKAAHYGGNLAITPRARLDRAEFEVCLIDSHSRLRYLYLLSHAMRGGVTDGSTSVRFVCTTHLRAHGHAPVQADGELIGHLPMTFEIIPDAIEIINNKDEG